MEQRHPWATAKGQERRLEVTDMRMPGGCMCGVTKRDEIKDENVRGSVKVAKKITDLKAEHIIIMVRMMSDTLIPGDGEEDRKPGGKTCATDIWKTLG